MGDFWGLHERSQVSPSFLHSLIRFLILFALELLLCPTLLLSLVGGASHSAASRDEFFSSEQRQQCVVDESCLGVNHPFVQPVLTVYATSLKV